MTSTRTVRDRARWFRTRVDAGIARARGRLPVLDHAVKAYDHYGDVLGSQLAAGVTYFAFLSFFPIVALAYAAVGFVVAAVPEARAAVTEALTSALPGLVGEGSGRLDVEELAARRAGVGLIGLIGLLYAGLGAVSAARTALYGVFHPSHSQEDRRGFLSGKARDVLVLVLVGLIVLLSVGIGTSVTATSGRLVRELGAEDVPGSGGSLWLAAVAVGTATSTVAFFAVYRLLPKRPPRNRDLWRGSLLAAVGFEVLKQLAGLVIGRVTGDVLYDGFAVLVALLVWMNYTSRLLVLGACWAATARERTPPPDEA